MKMTRAGTFILLSQSLRTANFLSNRGCVIVFRFRVQLWTSRKQKGKTVWYASLPQVSRRKTYPEF